MFGGMLDTLKTGRIQWHNAVGTKQYWTVQLNTVKVFGDVEGGNETWHCSGAELTALHIIVAFTGSRALCLSGLYFLSLVLWLLFSGYHSLALALLFSFLCSKGLMKA